MINQYQSLDGSMGENYAEVSYAEVDNLKGRVLTLIDASFADPEQRKAMKDILKQTINAWIEETYTDQPHSEIKLLEDRANAHTAHIRFGAEASREHPVRDRAAALSEAVIP